MNIVKYLPRRIREAHSALKRLRPLAPRTCPICSYSGYFNNAGRPPRLDAKCPSCGSMERHRLFWLWYATHTEQVRPPILHFAAEPVYERQFRTQYVQKSDAYRTADLFTSADLQLDIEHMALPDTSVSTVICNHVLEHVNDRNALDEIYRVLCDDGVAILSVPTEEGWAHTYEDTNITNPKARKLHFGQRDHVRYYGRDFRDRLSAANFKFVEITSSPADVAKYGLLRGDRFFLCRKAGTQQVSETP